MNYKKTQPEITLDELLTLAEGVNTFKSLKGNQYEIISIDDSTINFIRKSSSKSWKMNLKGVLTAYKELTNFKTKNFKPYVPRTHSPALGLLLHLGLLKQ